VGFIDRQACNVAKAAEQARRALPEHDQQCIGVVADLDQPARRIQERRFCAGTEDLAVDRRGELAAAIDGVNSNFNCGEHC
jgi:hypothetical protein